MSTEAERIEAAQIAVWTAQNVSLDGLAMFEKRSPIGTPVPKPGDPPPPTE